MMNPPAGERTEGTAGPIKGGPGQEEEVPAGLRVKLVLTVFPFLLVLLFLVVEWWIRGRS